VVVAHESKVATVRLEKWEIVYPGTVYPQDSLYSRQFILGQFILGQFILGQFILRQFIFRTVYPGTVYPQGKLSLRINWSQDKFFQDFQDKLSWYPTL